jgi:hypothetical protein
MSWDQVKSADKMRRLLLASQDPHTKAKWAPHLATYCEELSELSPRLRKNPRNQVLALLLEATPYFSAQGQVVDLLRWLDPFLTDPKRNLTEDFFLLCCTSVLESETWGKIGDALEDLRSWCAKREDLPNWVAFAKSLVSSIEGLYAKNRFSTADSYHRLFESIPPKHRSVTRMYQSQASLAQARHHSRNGQYSKILSAVEELANLYLNQPSEILRQNYAAGVVALAPELLTEDKLEVCLKQGHDLFHLVARYPEDPELGAEAIHYLGITLPVLLRAEKAEVFLKYLSEILATFQRPEILGEKVSEILLQLAEQDLDLTKEKLPLLRLTVDEIERRFGGGSLTLSERCARFRKLTGLPPRTAGCLTLVLALSLLSYFA